jgi:hypothetical protein
MLIKNGVSGMLRRVALVRIDVFEVPSASIIKVTRIGERLILFLLHRFLSLDDGGAKFLRNVSSYKSHTA